MVLEATGIIYIIIFSAIALAGVYFRIRKHLKTTAKVIKETSKVIKGENSYEQLRNQAISVQPEQIGFSFSSNATEVYGIVMDWEMRGSIATIVAFASGDASLYISTGGGVTGGGQHKNVSDAAKKLVRFSTSFIVLSIPAKVALLPQENRLRFYLLTNNGLFTHHEYMHNIENETSKWYPLFVEVNKVMSELRVISEK